MNYQKEKIFKNPAYNCIKKIKYLVISLTKEVKDLYYESFKTLMKEIESTHIKGKIYHAHGLEELLYC